MCVPSYMYIYCIDESDITCYYFIFKRNRYFPFCEIYIILIVLIDYYIYSFYAYIAFVYWWTVANCDIILNFIFCFIWTKEGLVVSVVFIRVLGMYLFRVNFPVQFEAYSRSLRAHSSKVFKLIEDYLMMCVTLN